MTPALHHQKRRKLLEWREEKEVGDWREAGSPNRRPTSFPHLPEREIHPTRSSLHSRLLHLFCSSFCKVEILICLSLEGPTNMNCNCYFCHYPHFSGIQTILWHNLHGGKWKCFNTILFCSTIANHKQLVVCESLVRKRNKINFRTKS